jgi:hypothetical protein
LQEKFIVAGATVFAQEACFLARIWISMVLLAVFAMGLSAGADDRIVPASWILEQIRAGEPVIYDGFTITGDIDLDKLGDLTSANELQYYREPCANLSERKTIVTSLIKIVNSTIIGRVNFNNTRFDKPVDLENTKFYGHVGFRGAILKEKLDLSNAQFSQDADFLGSIFSKYAYFNETQFLDFTDFEGVYFDDYVKISSDFINVANFGNSHFNGTSDFTDANFNDYANFNGSGLTGYTYFKYARFNDYADFSSACFKGCVSFLYARFSGIANFNGASFNGNAYFNDAGFKGDTDFASASFNDHASFNRVVFKGNASFFDSRFKGDSSFSYARFNGIADFNGASFGGDAEFNGAGFKGDIDFAGAGFKGNVEFIGADCDSYAKFSGAVFNGTASFRDATFNSTGFQAVQFTREATFQDALFVGPADFESIRFKGDALFENATLQKELSLKRAKYDKLYIRWDALRGGLAYDDTAYMSLMKNFKDLGYYEDYDNCYYHYRVAHRAVPWPSVPDWKEPFLKLFDYPLDWIYGYGTNPFNAFLFSLAIVFVFAFFWWIVGLGGPKDKTLASLKTGEDWLDGGFADILGFSVTVFLSGTKLFIDPPSMPKIEDRSRSWIKTIFILERWLGALFSILFFIAISGTIVRAS